MTELVAGEMRILQALQQAPDGLLNKDLQRICGLFPSNLSKFLKRLQGKGFVERDAATRRYKAVPLGKSVTNATEMDIITRDDRKKLTVQLASNADDVYWVGLFPVEASVYLSPEITDLISDVKREKGDLYQAKDTVLRYAARQAETLFERLFFLRLSTFVESYFNELTHQNGAELSNISLSQVKRGSLTSLISDLRKRHKKIDSSNYGLSRLLDFNAAIVVKVWNEALTRNSEDVKNRIVMHQLFQTIQYLDALASPRNQRNRNALVTPIVAFLAANTKMGLLSDEEFDRICQAKSIKGMTAVVRTLAIDYYVKVYHEKPNMETLLKAQQSSGELERILNQTR